MDETPEFDAACEVSFEQYKEHGRELSNLPSEMQTIVTIATTQGIIGNGGLVYFFERDFDDQPSYESIAMAYDRIGATVAANVLRSAVKSFPFEDPHLHEQKRLECMENWRDNGGGPEIDFLWPWDCQEVFRLAEEYVKSNRAVFGIA